MAAAPPDAPDREGGKAAPEIAVVVVNWRRPEATIECCRRLLAWEEIEARVIVVDNGSGAETVARLERDLAGVEVLACETNSGFGGANNLAFERLASRFTLLLNNDASLEEAAAKSLVDFMRAEPEAGIVGPVLEAAEPPHAVLAAGGRDILRSGRTHFRAAERESQLQAAQPFQVDYVPGTAALIRTSLVRRLGGFDEAYFFSGEMADLARRARDLGFESFVVPRARARHDLELASDLRDSLYAYYSLRNRFLSARRHARRPSWHLARWAARGSLGCLAALIQGNTRRARCLARAIADGVAGRFGPANERVAP